MDDPGTGCCVDSDIVCRYQGTCTQTLNAQTTQNPIKPPQAALEGVTPLRWELAQEWP